MPNFHDLFSNFAGDYKTYRPVYPQALFEYLAAICPEHRLAWDCATGNGQAAEALKPFFQRVIATDASYEQVSEANPTPGIEYAVSLAEQTMLPPSSVDLVVVAQALHWFDLSRFFAEAKRALKPGGIIACWCYGLMTIGEPIDALIRNLYHEVLDGYWSSERALVDQQYKTIGFPFAELHPPEFQASQTWTLDQLIGYLNTWSAVRKYEQQNGVNPVAQVAGELTQAWENSDAAKEVVWPLYLRVGRMPYCIRPVAERDVDGIVAIFRRVVATGDTYVYPPHSTAAEARQFWLGGDNQVFVAEFDDRIAGTYYLKPNQPGLGSHVANAGFMVHPEFQSKGVGKQLGKHALDEARRQGYRAMQFNFVVSTNQAAVELWKKLGFKIAGVIPQAFKHRRLGFVDVLIMHRPLD